MFCTDGKRRSPPDANGMAMSKPISAELGKTSWSDKTSTAWPTKAMAPEAASNIHARLVRAGALKPAAAKLAVAAKEASAEPRSLMRSVVVGPPKWKTSRAVMTAIGKNAAMETRTKGHQWFS